MNSSSSVRMENGFITSWTWHGKEKGAQARQAAASPACPCPETLFAASQDNGALLSQLRAGTDLREIGTVYVWFEDYKKGRLSKLWRANVIRAPRRENNLPLLWWVVFFPPPKRSLLLLPHFVRDFLASALPRCSGVSAVLKIERIGVESRTPPPNPTTKPPGCWPACDPLIPHSSCCGPRARPSAVAGGNCPEECPQGHQAPRCRSRGAWWA